jgi:tetratricopeptide (TPR) repeat protein
MGFAGNLRTFPLSEVMQTINRIASTGVLRLVSGDISREVIFQQGQVVGVAFPQGQERQALLSRLIMQGHLDATDAASMSTGSSASQVIAALVESQLVTKDEVAEAAKDQAEEELYSLFTWESADFTFFDASVPALGSGGTETYAKVQHHAGNKLQVNLNSALMEAARRADEWNRLKAGLPDASAVPGPAEGCEAALAKAGAAFPGIAVVPLIDAVRSLDDIVADAVVTRLEVYGVLAGLAEARQIVWLSRDDLVAHGDWQAAQGEHRRAAALYRKALARDGRDQETRHKLAATLEQLGDEAEGAASYAQLALAALDGNDLPLAHDLAAKAVGLAPGDGRWRNLMGRILAAAGDTDGAASEYVMLAAQHETAGRYEEARSAGREVLAIKANDTRALRVLARITLATVGDPRSDGRLACPACDQLNDADAHICTACRSPLHLPCIACGNQVSMFDAVCSVCAADPHAEASTLLAAARSEASDISKVAAAIVDAVQVAAAGSHSGGKPAVGSASGASRGVQQWREQLDSSLLKAQAREEAGDWSAALVAWRAVATLQPDSPALVGHIKEIEGRLHELTIERGIERGHQLRRTRHYFKAVREYRTALRLMGATDPRAKPVGEALRRAERDRTRASALFAAAGIVVLAMGGLALYPYVLRHRFRSQLDVVRQDVTALAVPGQISDISLALDDLTLRSAAMPGVFARQAKQDLDDVSGDFAQAQVRLAGESIARINAALKARDVASAQAGIVAHAAAFRPEFQGLPFATAKERLTTLKTELRLHEDALQAAPAQLAAAAKLEEGNRLAEALAAFRALASVTHAEVTATATAAIARLEPQEAAYRTLWDNTIRVVAADLGRSAELDALTAGSRPWGRDVELKRLREDAAARLAAAAAAWKTVEASADPAAFDAFIAAHPGTPQISQATTRRATLAARQGTRDQAVATQRAQLAAGRWQEAWQSGQDLLTAYRDLVDPATIELPLMVVSRPPGATLSRAGEVLGVAPLVVRCRPGEGGQLTATAPGWGAAVVELTVVDSAWQTHVILPRVAAWSVTLDRPAGVLASGDLGILAVGRDSIALVAKGQVRWRARLPADEFGAGDRIGHPAVLTPDGLAVVALPTGGLALFTPDGATRPRVAIPGDLRGRPLAYINEIYGPLPRLAVAATGLRCGTPGGEILAIPLPSPAISGPLAFARDLDRLLVVADVDGHLTAVEESTRTVAWRLDLQASDCGDLVAGDARTVLMVLDGVRLAACAVEGAPALRWTMRLPAAVVGEPAVAGAAILVAAGAAIVRADMNGTALPPITLPAVAATGVAAAGNLAAVGCSDGTLVVLRDGAIAWTSPLGHRPLAVTIAGGQVVAALDDGTLRAFIP